jgi:hypothetical protein
MEDALGKEEEVISAKVVWSKQPTENMLKVRFTLFNNKYLKNTGI